jgi:hypothetical protein
VSVLGDGAGAQGLSIVRNYSVQEGCSASVTMAGRLAVSTCANIL